jgi:hypothetical protein
MVAKVARRLGVDVLVGQRRKVALLKLGQCLFIGGKELLWISAEAAVEQLDDRDALNVV